MSLPVFTPPVAPSPGTQVANEVSLHKTPFGDGYAQASPKGLRHVRRRVSLRWDALTLDQAREIEAFFRERGGWQPFAFTVRGDAGPSTWTCETWTLTDAAPATFSAELVEWFGG